ncbi:hypothetical protein AAF712_015535 [Marasmius tenuissimus]|uniref:Uncharacterized protein n=1 Tax=Marasmius tenuissimus TaxID=585030 RepID=A0ABR2ZA68_9AGAR
MGAGLSGCYLVRALDSSLLRSSDPEVANTTTGDRRVKQKTILHRIPFSKPLNLIPSSKIYRRREATLPLGPNGFAPAKTVKPLSFRLVASLYNLTPCIPEQSLSTYHAIADINKVRIQETENADIGKFNEELSRIFDADSDSASTNSSESISIV